MRNVNIREVHEGEELIVRHRRTPIAKIIPLSMPAPCARIKRALAALLADREEPYLPLCVHQPATSPLSGRLKREGRPTARDRRLAVIWCRERPCGRPVVAAERLGFTVISGAEPWRLA